jgi:8-oxo-dGTP pyrophosphatase MutT (NUDIX family)
MRPCGLDVAATTAGQPFCAGVILVVDGRLVATLNRDHLPAELDGNGLRVGGVGGGQEPGETIWECAVREAFEETGSQVKLVNSPRTYIREPDGLFRRVRCRDDVAPLLFESGPRDDPAPYKPGLPAGQDLFNAFFLGRASQEPQPRDVEGLLLMPADHWSLVAHGATIDELLEAGASVLERVPIARDTRVWAFPEDSLGAVCELVAREPELLSPLR